MVTGWQRCLRQLLYYIVKTILGAGVGIRDMREVATKYRLEAEQCFSIACAADDPKLREQSLSNGIHWLRLADEMERRSARAKRRTELRLVHSR